MSSIRSGFQEPRQITDVADLFRWLDVADALEPIREIKRRMLEVRPVQEGEQSHRADPHQACRVDARGLDLADDSFDVSRAERVLRYVEGPEQVLREMAEWCVQVGMWWSSTSIPIKRS